MEPAFYYPGLSQAVPVGREQFTLNGLQILLGGELEVVQLDEATCLLINSRARELSLPKNKPASEIWFARHPESGMGADFIYGPAVHCDAADVVPLDHLQAQVKPVFTKEQAQQLRTADALRDKQHRQQAEAALLCSVENKDDCVMCGS